MYIKWDYCVLLSNTNSSKLQLYSTQPTCQAHCHSCQKTFGWIWWRATVWRRILEQIWWEWWHGWMLRGKTCGGSGAGLYVQWSRFPAKRGTNLEQTGQNVFFSTKGRLSTHYSTYVHRSLRADHIYSEVTPMIQSIQYLIAISDLNSWTPNLNRLLENFIEFSMEFWHFLLSHSDLPGHGPDQIVDSEQLAPNPDCCLGSPVDGITQVVETAKCGGQHLRTETLFTWVFHEFWCRWQKCMGEIFLLLPYIIWIRTVDRIKTLPVLQRARLSNEKKYILFVITTVLCHFILTFTRVRVSTFSQDFLHFIHSPSTFTLTLTLIWGKVGFSCLPQSPTWSMRVQ